MMQFPYPIPSRLIIIVELSLRGCRPQMQPSDPGRLKEETTPVPLTPVERVLPTQVNSKGGADVPIDLLRV